MYSGNSKKMSRACKELPKRSYTKTKNRKKGENLVFSLRREEFLQLHDDRGRLYILLFSETQTQTPHRDTLPIIGSRKLRLGRLYRVQCGCKLIGPKLFAVSHLAVPLRFLRGRSTRRPQALRQQLDQICRMRLISQYQHACGHQITILPIDIISTNTSSWINSAAKAAHMPEVKVAIAGVPVAGQTWLRLLRK
ncbi:hypothetical protein ALC53_07663 [Atta colombica]|uniref:Uncharacterized protein n=1 Tax=Atta colombica TaxID=520822 RepID=A0A195BBE1_9HYME|nr:hypothetical protein ALC53_07663 [Atta colombica]